VNSLPFSVSITANIIIVQTHLGCPGVVGLGPWTWSVCAPLKVSGLIPSRANFGELVHTELCYGFKWVGLDPSD